MIILFKEQTTFEFVQACGCALFRFMVTWPLSTRDQDRLSVTAATFTIKTLLSVFYYISHPSPPFISPMAWTLRGLKLLLCEIDGLLYFVQIRKSLKANAKLDNKAERCSQWTKQFFPLHTIFYLISTHQIYS